MKVLLGILWFLGFGLLPFWAATAFVFIGGIGESSEYWAAAPWLMVFAIPFCAVTLVMAAATFAVHAAVSGGPSRKLKFAGGAFALMTAVVLAAGGWFWRQHQAQEDERVAREERARVFVERHPDVKAAAPPGYRTSLSSSQYDGNGNLLRLHYYVYSLERADGALMAIVDFMPGAGPAEFRLACAIPEHEYRNADSRSDPCASARSRDGTGED